MKNWSFRKKNIALLIAIPIVIILGYFLSFSKTIELHQENNKMLGYEGQKENLPLQIASVNKGIQRLDSLILMNEESYQARLINTLTTYCEQYGTTLIEAKGVKFPQYENLPYETYSLKVEGRYINLIKTLNAMEGDFGLGKVQSVNFLRETNRKTKRVSLTLNLYLTRVIIDKTTK